MKLNGRADIEAPAERVWQALTAFDHWERVAMRRGVEVLRLAGEGPPEPGAAWQVGFAWRGRPRRVALRLTGMEPRQSLVFEGSAAPVEGRMQIDVVEISPRRTRLAVTTEIRPRTLAARLFVQSLALARRRVVRRYQERIGRFAAAVEQRLGLPPRP